LRFGVLISAPHAGLFGSPAARRILVGLQRNLRCYVTPFPAHFRSRFILPYALRLFRVLPSLSLPRVSRRGAPPLGLPSLFATSVRSVLTPGFHPRSLAVLDVSHVLNGFRHHEPCGFISPHSRVQGSLSRGFPPRTAEPPRRRPVPSCRLAEVRYRQFPTGATNSRPAFRALIRTRIRCLYSGV
jgi:hypothetical protein